MVYMTIYDIIIKEKPARRQVLAKEPDTQPSCYLFPWLFTLPKPLILRGLPIEQGQLVLRIGHRPVRLADDDALDADPAGQDPLFGPFLRRVRVLA